jgi:hypothetical protein
MGMPEKLLADETAPERASLHDNAHHLPRYQLVQQSVQAAYDIKKRATKQNERIIFYQGTSNAH